MRTYWNITCRDKYGNIIWEELALPNIVHNEGEEALLSAYFATAQSGFGAPPANLYIGLRSGSITNADTLASITEVSGTSYARQPVSTTTGFTLSFVSSHWQALSSNVTFTAGGAWTQATALFLCTTISGTSGKMISSVALTTPRTLASTETIQVSCFVTLAG